jgi:hypothetical protein
MAYMPGAKGLMYLSGAAVATATNEVQTLTFGGAPAGNYILSVRGYQLTIAWSNVNATLLAALQAALDGVPGVGAGSIVATAGALTAGVGTVLLTYSGVSVAGRPQGGIVVISPPSPGTLSVAITTPGAEQNPPLPGKHALYMNLTTGQVYSNSGGTPAAPVWALLAVQT